MTPSEMFATVPLLEERLALLERELADANLRAGTLLSAIITHRDQKRDDMCWMDDDVLYTAAGLSPRDHTVGDQAAMLKNCERYIRTRCEGGNWKSYAELEVELARVTAAALRILDRVSLVCSEGLMAEFKKDLGV